MLRLLFPFITSLFVTAQTTVPLVFTNTKSLPITGNYTLGYVNNTIQNRCHKGVAKFQAQQTGIVDSMTMGVYSQTGQETCGISFVLATFPAGTVVGSSVLTTFTDLVLATPGVEAIAFNTSASSWSVVTGQNYTVTVLPFTWATAPAGGTASASHCVFDIPYGTPGIPYFFLGEYGPTGLPCGSTPWVIDKAGDGLAMQLKLTGRPASIVVPSATPSVTPTPTSSTTPTPSSTGTPTPSATPTGTPTNTETPTQTLAPGSTPSNSATSTRTPSRTPSISYTPTPTSSVTSSITPTPTPSPTPSLRIGASPSITPTETPGPTDSSSPKPVAGIATQPVVVTTQSNNSGSLIGAAIGGGLLVVGIIAIAIRFKIVHAEINNNPQVTTWKRKKSRVPDIDIGLNPAITQNPALAIRISKMMEGHNPVVSTQPPSSST